MGNDDNDATMVIMVVEIHEMDKAKSMRARLRFPVYVLVCWILLALVDLYPTLRPRDFAGARRPSALRSGSLRLDKQHRCIARVAVIFLSPGATSSELTALSFCAWHLHTARKLRDRSASDGERGEESGEEMGRTSAQAMMSGRDPWAQGELTATEFTEKTCNGG